jgi:sirohydrochlorin cobaltochelatase
MEPHVVLLIAHGSRQEPANRELREMAERLSKRLEGTRVIPCFLDVVSPTIEEAFEEAVQEGATKITVVPFFVGTGAHVGEDIPRILDECRAKHSDLQIEIKLTPAIGPDPLLDEIALSRIYGAG